jgi:hypothetical protein
MALRVQGETAKVLITVKTAPQPSTSYGDTVCVAGVRLDTPKPEWIRLYPIPFRWLDSDQKFRKYDIVDLEVRRRDQDSRLESYSPTIESIQIVGHLDDWKAREPIMRGLNRTTTCDLRAAAKVSHSAPSLGIVSIADIERLEFEANAGWTPKEEAKIAEALRSQREDLFGTTHAPPKLVAPRFKVKYHYRCEHTKCPGHDGQILDWELTELQRRQPADDEVLKSEVTKRFLTQMYNAKKATSFFMGNFEAAIKRQSFSVLGVYYPDRKTATEQTLFDL